jgi:hypothetical protein
MTDVRAEKGSVLAGLIWMLVLSILLFWLPLIGPLVAGFVGGKKSGGLGKAILAVFIPAIFFAIMLFVFSTALTGLPLIGAVAAAGGFVLAAAEVGPLLIGAVVGGLMA